MDFNPDEIYRQVLAVGEDWADKKGAYEALTDNTKSVLADITSRYMDSKVSRAEAEMRAYASSDYKNHTASLSKARNAWLSAQVKYDSIKMLADLRRSEESTKRAEMTLK